MLKILLIVTIVYGSQDPVTKGFVVSSEEDCIKSSSELLKVDPKELGKDVVGFSVGCGKTFVKDSSNGI